jgi:excisionase family DNA binding protein
VLTPGASLSPAEPVMRRTSAVKPTGRLLSLQGAAEYLGVPRTTIRDWAVRGHVPVVRVPDCRRIWLDRRDLDRLIEAWKERD